MSYTHWNYRVLYDGEIYRVIEVYYSNSGGGDRITAWSEASAPTGDDLRELIQDGLDLSSTTKNARMIEQGNPNIPVERWGVLQLSDLPGHDPGPPLRTLVTP